MASVTHGAYKPRSSSISALVLMHEMIHPDVVGINAIPLSSKLSTASVSPTSIPRSSRPSVRTISDIEISARHHVQLPYNGFIKRKFQLLHFSLANRDADGGFTAHGTFDATNDL
jgi:hypothetical protein